MGVEKTFCGRVLLNRRKSAARREAWRVPVLKGRHSEDRVCWGSKGHVGDLQQIRMLHKQSCGGSAGTLRKLRGASLISGALSTTALGYCRSPKRCQLWLQQRQAKRRVPD